MKRTLMCSVVLAMLALVGCGANNGNHISQQSSGSLFVTGEDAPLSSVVSFQLTLNSVTLNGAKNTPQVISNTTVDFARLIGLRSPLSFNSVPADTYQSATITVSSPVITYVDMTQNPPALNTIKGTLPANPYTVTVNLPSPMVVSNNGLAGLKMELDIHQSVAVDGNGNVTGAVNPVFYVKATKASDPDGQITDLMGGLVSVNASGNSFVLQGPYGHQLTIDVNSSTQFNSGWNINDLATPAWVSVQGAFQTDGTLLASGVEVITTAHSFVSGRVLQVVKNGSGQAQSVTMWVGETGADMVNLVDTIQTFNVSLVSQYDICFLNGPLTNLVFNDTTMVVGQRIFVGGSYSGGVFTPAMISLRLQGVYGTFVPASVTITNGNAGSFELTNNGLVGYAAGGPVTVNTFNFTFFFDLNGLDQLASTGTNIPLVTRGLLLMNPSTGTPEVYAGFVADPPQN
jgi:hypothetical protein